MQFDLETALVGLAKAVAVATVIGGGTMVLEAHRDNALQDQRDVQFEQQLDGLNDTLKEFRVTVQELDKNVAVLTERMKEK